MPRHLWAHLHAAQVAICCTLPCLVAQVLRSRAAYKHAAAVRAAQEASSAPVQAAAGSRLDLLREVEAELGGPGGSGYTDAALLHLLQVCEVGLSRGP